MKSDRINRREFLAETAVLGSTVAVLRGNAAASELQAAPLLELPPPQLLVLTQRVHGPLARSAA